MKLSPKMKDFLSNEVSKLKKMSTDDRKWYIWEYYKIPLVALAVALALLLSWIVQLLNPEEIYLHNAAINLLDETAAEPAALTSQFQEDLGLGRYETVSCFPFTMALNGEYVENDQIMIQKLELMVGVGELDLLFMTEKDMMTLSGLSMYADLETVLPAELWEQAKDRAVYLTDPESGVRYAAGLDVSDCPIIQECEFYGDNVRVCITTGTPRLEHCLEMIRYILNEG